MEATLQGFEGMEALGRKKRKARRPKPIRWITSLPPSFAMPQYNPASKVDALPPPPPPEYIERMPQYNPASKVDALPPPPPPEYIERMPRVEPAKGHSDRNNFINSGLDVLDRFVNKGNAAGSVYQDRVAAPDRRTDAAGRDIGAEAGRAAGNLADTAGDIVNKHPLAVLGAVGALLLLLVNPFDGKKR